MADTSPSDRVDTTDTLRRKASGSLAIRLLLATIILGVLARVLRYGLDLQVHHDEAYLLNNILAKSYADLLKPLANAQAAPPAFCWLTKWCSGFGDGNMSARCVAFVAAMAAFGLFASLCRRTLKGSAALFALSVFAASHVLIVSTVRAKPYAMDLLIGTLFVWLAVNWMARPRRKGCLLILALAAPIVVWLSYPSVFVVGGVGAVLGVFAALQRRRLPPRTWLYFGMSGVFTLVSGVALYTLHVKSALHGAGNSGLRAFWSDAFPPSGSLPRTLWWLITVHTGRMYAYPVGEKMFGSAVPFLLWFAGVIAMGRTHRDRWVVGLLLAPQVLLIIAAFAGIYPYGGHARLSLFLAPAMCLFIGAGTADLTRRLRLDRRQKWRAVAAGVLLAIPIIEMAGDIASFTRARSHPTLARMLADIDDQAGPRDRVVCLNKSMILASGGPARQIFEYEMNRKLGGRVRWQWDGQISSLLDSPLDRSHAAPFQVFVIVYGQGSDGDPERLFPEIFDRWGPVMGSRPRRRCRVLPGYAGEVDVWRITLDPQTASSFDGEGSPR